jgi:o-succinylbenzoate---CoA ligase
MFKLHFDNRVYSKSGDFEPIKEALPDFAHAAFSFCKSWLEGETLFIQSTSGSTGAPKQIHISRQQMEASAKATGAFFQTDSHSRLLCCLNPAFIAGKMMLVRAMVWGCEIHLIEPSSNPLKNFNEKIDFAALVPMQVQVSLADETSLINLQSIKNVIVGGAALSSQLQAELVKKGIHAWQTFGMTETVSHIALAKISNEELIYEALPGVSIGQDSRGTLWVQSEMSGPAPVQTNDLIELQSNNSFRWFGRVDFVVNSGGIKLFPEVIEKKAEEVIFEIFPSVRYIFCGEQDELLGERLVLLLETNYSSSREKILTDRLRDVLGPYEMPKRIRFKSSFALTENGKINRSATLRKI